MTVILFSIFEIYISSKYLKLFFRCRRHIQFFKWYQKNSCQVSIFTAILGIWQKCIRISTNRPSVGPLVPEHTVQSKCCKLFLYVMLPSMQSTSKILDLLTSMMVIAVLCDPTWVNETCSHKMRDKSQNFV